MVKKAAAPEDPKILEYVQTHDATLLNEIIEEYIPWIKHAVARINPSFPVLDRDDLLQCGLIGFMGALNRFNPERGVPFKAWALLRVRGAAIDAVRKVSSTARTRDVHMIRLTDGYTTDEEDLADLRLSDGASPALREAILELPIQQGLILLLFIHGMSAVQTATIVGRSEGTIYQERNAAIETLRDVLADKLGEFV